MTQSKESSGVALAPASGLDGSYGCFLWEIVFLIRKWRIWSCFEKGSAGKTIEKKDLLFVLKLVACVLRS
jgi:hypothetical protein